AISKISPNRTEARSRQRSSPFSPAPGRLRDTDAPRARVGRHTFPPYARPVLVQPADRVGSLVLPCQPCAYFLDARAGRAPRSSTTGYPPHRRSIWFASKRPRGRGLCDAPHSAIAARRFLALLPSFAQRI